MKTLIAQCVAGASVLELSIAGDKLLDEGAAGLYNKVKGIPKGASTPTLGL